MHHFVTSIDEAIKMLSFLRYDEMMNEKTNRLILLSSSYCNFYDILLHKSFSKVYVEKNISKLLNIKD